MKFITLLVLCLAFSLVISTRLFNRHRNHHKHKLSTKGAFMDFIAGFINGATGQDAVTVCKNALDGKDGDVASNKEVASKEETPLWQKILKLLGKIIDVCCKWKSKIIEWITKKWRRYRRLFLQGKSTKGFWGDIWNGIKSAGNAIVETVKDVAHHVYKVGEFVWKSAQELWTWLKEKIENLFGPIFDAFKAMKKKIMDWIETNPTIKALLRWLKCIMTAKDAAKGLISIAKGFITLIPKLTNPVGWVQLAVNLICGWEKLKNGIEAMLKAIKGENSARNWGEFAGNIIAAISGA